MRRPSNEMVASFLVLSAAALGCGGGGGGADCTKLTNYTATVTTPPSFATDIYPILASTSLTGGCSQAIVCHGMPPIRLDSGDPTNPAIPAKTLRFLISTDPTGDPGPATMAD